MMKIKEKAYQLYKFDWLSSHGYTMEDVVYMVMEILDVNNFDFKNFNMSGNDAKYVLDLLEEIGFNGEIYACFDEFIDSEYQDRHYMERLLGGTESDDYKAYIKDVGEEQNES